MCGITGLWTPGSWNSESICSLRRMAAAIHHRGPDDCGFYCDEALGLGFGFRRLAILDLSAEGHQPMTSISGRYVVVYNGESYNFLELRPELSAAGIPFRGRSDTEVLLAGFERWGVHGTVDRLVGMFAMAVWDRQTESLHLVRDRLGEKPLYYARLGRTFVFGSELKALRAHPQWIGSVDRGALALYLRYLYVPTPYSIYDGVRKVVPGTILTIRKNGDVTEDIYWSASEVVTKASAEPLHGSDDELVEACDALLRRTVRQEMISDVPLGAFLSGGIDSSVVVALMQAQASSPVRTFTIGYEEEKYNEADHARAVARHIGTDHTEMYVSSSDAMAVVPRLSAIYDEPFADSSQIPTLLVSQLARQHVTVSLSGDGGDELFGGYNRYVWGPRVASWLRRVPSPVRATGAALLRSLPPHRWDTYAKRLDRILPSGLRVRVFGDQAHKLADVLSLRSDDDLYGFLASHWIGTADFGRDTVDLPTILSDRKTWPPVSNFVDRMMFLDLVSYMRDDILVKVDRATMGVSLESRAPFLDHRVVEFAWRLPRDMKLRDGVGKFVLRKVLDRYVPRALVDRPKMGFAVPIDSWLRGPMRAWAAELLEPRRLQNDGFFNADAVTRCWKDHQAGKNRQHALWAVLMFQAWHDTAAVPAMLA